MHESPSMAPKLVGAVGACLPSKEQASRLPTEPPRKNIPPCLIHSLPLPAPCAQYHADPRRNRTATALSAPHFTKFLQNATAR